MESNGVQNQPFQESAEKVICGFCFVNNHIPTVLDPSFSDYFPAETGAANWCPNKSLEIHLFLISLQNVCILGAPGEADYLPNSTLFLMVHPLGPKGVPGQPSAPPRHAF